MTGRFKEALLEKGTMPKKFSVKSGDKSKAGGLTAKGVKRYRAANPGSKLKTAVTTKPSKLKKGSKSASRRKSFCARMGGMKKRLTSAETARDPDSRINKALRKWNCSTDVNPNNLNYISESFGKMIKDKIQTFKSNFKQGAKDAKQGFLDGLTGGMAKHARRQDLKAKRDFRAKAFATQEKLAKRKADQKALKQAMQDEAARKAAAKELEARRAKVPENPRAKTRDEIKAELEAKKARTQEARLNLAEKCWVGWTQKGLKKKGNKMVPNCVKEGEDPRMKTTPSSIQQAGGDPDAYKKEKAKKDPKPVSKKASPARRDTLGRSGGKFRRERIQPAKGAEGPSAPTRQVPAKSDVKGGKENFKKGTSEKPMSKKDVNKMGVRGQESKIAAKKKAMGKKTRAANIQLMKDMGVLKFDKQGKRIRAKKRAMGRVGEASNLLETFQGLNMKRRAGRVDRVLKGREKQEKRTGPQGLAGKLLGRKYDADANQRAERKKRDLEARRGRGAALDRAEQERRGGGTYTKDGRRVDKALKKQRKTRGEKIYKDSDVEREDLPPSPRIQRRRDKVAAEVERKRANKAAAEKAARAAARARDKAAKEKAQSYTDKVNSKYEDKPSREERARSGFQREFDRKGFKMF